MTTAVPTSTEERALALLGQGFSAEVVASAVGVSPSRISQLLSQAEFASKVSELRYNNLAEHTVRDSKYDKLEDKLLDKLDSSLLFMSRPTEIARVLQAVNGAKRRGSSAPEALVEQKEVVKLVMPTIVNQKFTLNINGQVIQAGTQELVTVQSGNMKKLLDMHKTPMKELTHERTNDPSAEGSNGAA